MIKIIAAVSSNSVIGQNNTLPWGDKYPQDMKYFRTITANSTVIMGRNTYTSLNRPGGLPKRRNIVITKNKIEGIECYDSLTSAIFNTIPQIETENIWLIGGFNIYSEGMKYADEIHLTLIPEEIKGDGLTYFPWIHPSKFEVKEFITLENSTPNLVVAKYIKIN